MSSSYYIKASIIPATAVAAMAALLTSCSTHYQVNTNLDPHNVKDYFSAAKVKIVANEQAFSGSYRYLGVVEGQDCQVKAYQHAPDEVVARTEARRNAFKLKANAVIFTGCASVQTKQCQQQLICYGKAYVTGEGDTAQHAGAEKR